MLKIKEINKKFIIFLIIIGLGILFVLPVLAAGDYGLEATREAAGLSMGTLPKILGNFIGAILSLVGVLFFALMLYGGITWMLARGNQEMEKKALNTITAAIIGIIIIISSYAITNFVFTKVYKGENTSSGGGGGGGGEGGGGNGANTEVGCNCDGESMEGVVSEPVCNFLSGRNFLNWKEYSSCSWINSSCTCSLKGGGVPEFLPPDTVTSEEVCRYLPSIVSKENDGIRYVSCVWTSGTDTEPVPEPPPGDSPSVAVGCGGTEHPDWSCKPITGFVGFADDEYEKEKNQQASTYPDGGWGGDDWIKGNCNESEICYGQPRAVSDKTCHYPDMPGSHHWCDSCAITQGSSEWACRDTNPNQCDTTGEVVSFLCNAEGNDGNDIKCCKAKP